jgi:hypothetical protein
MMYGKQGVECMCIRQSAGLRRSAADTPRVIITHPVRDAKTTLNIYILFIPESQTVKGKKYFTFNHLTIDAGF